MPTEKKGITNTEKSSSRGPASGANSDNSSPKQPKNSTTKSEGTETVGGTSKK